MSISLKNGCIMTSMTSIVSVIRILTVPLLCVGVPSFYMSFPRFQSIYDHCRSTDYTPTRGFQWTLAALNAQIERQPFGLPLEHRIVSTADIFQAAEATVPFGHQFSFSTRSAQSTSGHPPFRFKGELRQSTMMMLSINSSSFWMEYRVALGIKNTALGAGGTSTSSLKGAVSTDKTQSAHQALALKQLERRGEAHV